ncbi:MAG: aminoacyl-tRNA hydrolase [Gemmatimonadota bacterium]|nr:aminoacyl-tRNA hydrolase [Gemmatimonadota bacterium]
MSEDLRIDDRLTIPRGELVTRATRSGGPGGQHVNRSSTRIELVWDLGASQVVDDALRSRLTARLGSRVDSEGKVRVVSSEHRSQLRNRQSAEERLAEVIRRALITPKKRKPTRPSRAAKQARLSDKRRRSDRKRDRRRAPED